MHVVAGDALGEDPRHHHGEAGPGGVLLDLSVVLVIRRPGSLHPIAAEHLRQTADLLLRLHQDLRSTGAEAGGGEDLVVGGAGDVVQGADVVGDGPGLGGAHALDPQGGEPHVLVQVADVPEDVESLLRGDQTHAGQVGEVVHLQLEAQGLQGVDHVQVIQALRLQQTVDDVVGDALEVHHPDGVDEHGAHVAVGVAHEVDALVHQVGLAARAQGGRRDGLPRLVRALHPHDVGDHVPAALHAHRVPDPGRVVGEDVVVVHGGAGGPGPHQLDGVELRDGGQLAGAAQLPGDVPEGGLVNLGVELEGDGPARGGGAPPHGLPEAGVTHLDDCAIHVVAGIHPAALDAGDLLQDVVDVPGGQRSALQVPGGGVVQVLQVLGHLPALLVQTAEDAGNGVAGVGVGGAEHLVDAGEVGPGHHDLAVAGLPLPALQGSGGDVAEGLGDVLPHDAVAPGDGVLQLACGVVLHLDGGAVPLGLHRDHGPGIQLGEPPLQLLPGADLVQGPHAGEVLDLACGGDVATGQGLLTGEQSQLLDELVVLRVGDG